MRQHYRKAPELNRAYNPMTKPSRALDLIRGLSGLVRHLCANRPDVVVSTANNMSLITAIGLWLAGAPAKLVLKTTNPIATSRHTGLVR